MGSSVVVSTVGFLKGVLAASYFGTSEDVDSYFVALLLPDLATRFALSGFFTFVPLFAAERSRSAEAAWRAAGKMLTLWLALLSLVAVAGATFSRELLPLIARGFEGQQLQDTVLMCRILFLMTASVGIAEILALPLIAQRRFLSATASQVSFQVSSTAFLVTFHAWGISSLVWGMVFGGFVQLLAICIGLGKDRQHLRLDFDPRNPVVRRMVRLTVPTYVGNAGAQLNGIVNRGFASLLAAGAVSSIQYAYMLTEAPVTLLANSATRALFPFMSTQYAEGGRRARANVNRALFTIAVLFAPIALGTYLIATPLVQCLFERGTFDSRSTAMTAGALKFYAPSILALALSRLMVGAFSAQQDTATPMRAGLVRVAINALLCYALVSRMGHLGIALANTVAEFVKCVLLTALLWRTFPGDEAVAMFRPYLRLLPPLAGMALVVSVMKREFLIGMGSWPLDTLLLVAVVLAGALAYLGGLSLFCRQELDFYRDIIREHVRLPAGLGRLAPFRVRP